MKNPRNQKHMTEQKKKLYYHYFSLHTNPKKYNFKFSHLILGFSFIEPTKGLTFQNAEGIPF